MAKAKVVIIGGGFGGVRAALNLAKLSNISIELISDKPDFRFFPALYRYVVGRSHQGSMIPLTDLFVNHSNVKVSITPALKVDAEKRIVTTKKGQLKYDYLIAATFTSGTAR
jgi:NADH dehydrogenase